MPPVEPAPLESYEKQLLATWLCEKVKPDGHYQGVVQAQEFLRQYSGKESVEPEDPEFNLLCAFMGWVTGKILVQGSVSCSKLDGGPDPS